MGLAARRRRTRADVTRGALTSVCVDACHDEHDPLTDEDRAYLASDDAAVRVRAVSTWWPF
jgi:hypothetical protein